MDMIFRCLEKLSIIVSHCLKREMDPETDAHPLGIELLWIKVKHWYRRSRRNRTMLQLQMD